METELTKEDFEDLAYAKRLLENPSLATKIVNAFGRPVESGLELLPDRWTGVVQHASRKALEKALDFALRTLERRTELPGIAFHKYSLAASGGMAGAIGLAALPLELPFSTVILLRSIADIARSEGEDINDPETKLNLLEVFALGGRTKKDEAAETGYYTVRASLATLVSDAARTPMSARISGKTSPVIIRLVDSIAARFGVVVSEKAMATLVPIVGAAGGAIVNMIFFNHFQDVARGHFIVRRLERKYGRERVREEYDKIESE